MTKPRRRLLTVSQARAFRTCPRLHHIRYGMGYRPVRTADPLRFGTLVHRGLEAWWLARQNLGDFIAAREAPLKEAMLAMGLPTEEHGEPDPFDLAKAECMLMGYDARWGPEPMRVLGVESEFRTLLRNPETGTGSRTFDIGGKVDAIVEIGGRILVVEHKTTSEDITLGSDYWRRLRLDAQASTYLSAARSLGYDAQAVLYDVLKKPGQQPLKATPEDKRKYKKTTGELYANQRENDETPKEYAHRLLEAMSEEPEKFFGRGEVVRLQSEEEDAAFDMWSTSRNIRDAELAGRHPRNPDACIRWGRECEYFDVCTGAADLEDPHRFQKVDRIHEELSEETSNEKGTQTP